MNSSREFMPWIEIDCYHHSGHFHSFPDTLSTSFASIFLFFPLIPFHTPIELNYVGSNSIPILYFSSSSFSISVALFPIIHFNNIPCLFLFLVLLLSSYSSSAFYLSCLLLQSFLILFPQTAQYIPKTVMICTLSDEWWQHYSPLNHISPTCIWFWMKLNILLPTIYDNVKLMNSFYPPLLAYEKE